MSLWAPYLIATLSLLHETVKVALTSSLRGEGGGVLTALHLSCLTSWSARCSSSSSSTASFSACRADIFSLVQGLSSSLLPLQSHTFSAGFSSRGRGFRGMGGGGGSTFCCPCRATLVQISSSGHGRDGREGERLGGR